MAEQLPKEPSPENLEATIERFLEALNGYAELYDRLSPELQNEWYDVEMEAKVSKNREIAKTRLEKFLKILEKTKE